MNLHELDRQYRTFVNSKYYYITLAAHQVRNAPFRIVAYIPLPLLLLLQNEFIQAHFLKEKKVLQLEYLDILDSRDRQIFL